MQSLEDEIKDSLGLKTATPAIDEILMSKVALAIVGAAIYLYSLYFGNYSVLVLNDLDRDVLVINGQINSLTAINSKLQHQIFELQFMKGELE